MVLIRRIGFVLCGKFQVERKLTDVFLLFLRLILQAMATEESPQKSQDSEERLKLFYQQRDLCMSTFEKWTESEQVEFVEYLLSRMCHYQHGHVNAYLKPMLQRDFITALPGILFNSKSPFSILFNFYTL